MCSSVGPPRMPSAFRPKPASRKPTSGGRPNRLKIRPSANAAEIQTTSIEPATSMPLASYTSRRCASRGRLELRRNSVRGRVLEHPVPERSGTLGDERQVLLEQIALRGDAARGCTDLCEVILPTRIQRRDGCLLYTSDAADERSSVDLG